MVSILDPLFFSVQTISLSIVSFPHYFLQATGHLAEQLKTREYIVARITSITERVVDQKVRIPTKHSIIVLIYRRHNRTLLVIRTGLEKVLNIICSKLKIGRSWAKINGG